MKNIIIYILLGTLISFSSCKKFLDREPISQVTPDNFFTTEQNAQAAVTGMYRTMLSSYSYGQSVVIVPEFSAQHVSHAANYPEYVNFKQHEVRIDNPWVLNMWRSLYTTINSANNVVKRVAEMSPSGISEEKRQQFILEAKFVRALNYFFLVRAFGDVPLIITPTDEEDNLMVPRNPLSEVYAQIILDLNDASALTNSYGSIEETKGRATGFAAKALLSKVHLYNARNTNDYTEAARLANEVITLGGFSLPDDFSSVWSAENTTESIFELQFDVQATNTLASVSNPTPSVLFLATGASIAELYEPGDKRRDFTVYQNSVEDSRFYIGKYRQFNPAVQNFPVIRLAEIYLIHAEAQARVDGSVTSAAYNSYKEVRDRANITTPLLNSFISLPDFIIEVQKEKRLELMFEGEAWFDYGRTGLALTEMMSNPNPNYLLYPIPDAERLINNRLSQNDDY